MNMKPQEIQLLNMSCRKEASRYHLSCSRERDILALQIEPASRGNITGTPASGNCDGKWEGLSSSNEQVERFHCRTTGAGSYTQQTFIVLASFLTYSSVALLKLYYLNCNFRINSTHPMNRMAPCGAESWSVQNCFRDLQWCEYSTAFYQ